MPCRYGEHVIACGIGGYTVTGRPAPKPRCKHLWLHYWHMGYIIGRVCGECEKRELMPGEWCRRQEKAVSAGKKAP